MNTIRKLALVHAVLASFVLAAPTQAADTTAANSVAMEVCSTTPKGTVPKEKLVKALNKMLDMGDTPKAATMSKEARRDAQFRAFWAELGSESTGG